MVKATWQEFDQSMQDADALPLDDIDIEAIGARFDLICKSVPRCKCGTYQVQVIQTAPPAVWRCRICKEVWEFEPDAAWR